MRVINKVLVVFVLCVFTFYNAQSQTQNVSINDNGDPPHSSAMLDISSATKGLLIPRVSLQSTSDVSTIQSPATSLLVFNTNTGMTGGGVGYWYWDGTQWVQAIGPQGPAGADGAAGPAGSAGINGVTGATGTAGVNGVTGATGAAGTTGITGPTGSTAIIHTITGTTDASILVATWTDMPEMTITFTPSKSNAIVLFTASGYGDGTGSEIAYAIIVKDGVSLLGTNSIAGINDFFGTFITSWNLGINYPVSLTVGVATTIKVQWRTYLAQATLYNYIVTDPDKTCHRTLTIYEY